MDNEDLLNKLKQGDELTYKFIFDQYYPLLITLAGKYLHDLDTSKEIAQNAFVKLYEKRQSIEISKALKSYLCRIVHNDCINYLHNKNFVDLKTKQFAKFLEEDANYITYVEQSEKEYKLHQLIEKLPTRCKEIFVLSRFENMKNGEIAKKFDISIRTVETQISNALKFIRDNYTIILFLFFNLFH